MQLVSSIHVILIFCVIFWCPINHVYDVVLEWLHKQSTIPLTDQNTTMSDQPLQCSDNLSDHLSTIIIPTLTDRHVQYFVLH